MYILLINFWISSISCLFFLPLTGNFGPWPRAVKPARFFVAGPAKKVQGLSNQYRHFKLFSISTGRNKPPGKISQSPRPRRPPQPPVTHTHTVCVPGCRRLVRPHTHSGPSGRSRIPPRKIRLASSLSQKQASRPLVESIFGGPALGEAPASGPWGFRHHGTSRRQTPTSAQARRRAGNGEERGRTPAPATPPRSRSRAPTSRTASPPPQPGARGLVAPQRIPQRKLCGPSPRRGARQRPVGVPSSRNLEAPDAHQRASTPQGRERGRAGANPSARNPATLPL